MTSINSIAILLAAFLVVFLVSSFTSLRAALGAQIDLLPSLMTYTALSANLSTVALLAVCAGLCFDSLSANPLGISIFPLFLIGALIHYHRSLLLRDHFTARCLLGLAAGAIAPVLVIILLLATGHSPLIGWASIWQWFVLAACGALFTPFWFALFGLLDRATRYPVRSEPPFRPDREIKRGL